MPYPNEHSARLREPGDFKEQPDWAPKGQKFARKADGTIYGSIKIPATIDVIWGQLKSQSGEAAAPQTLRFPTKDWTAEQAKKWLADNNVKHISFESASEAQGAERMIVNLSQPRAFASPGLEIDRGAGEIRNVSIMTAGEAIGHPFVVDEMMLQQVVAAVNKDVRGIKSRFTHPGQGFFDNTDPIEVMVGRTHNARIDGNQVRGDIKFGKYADSSPRGKLMTYLMDIAEEDPEVIGMSINFERAEFAAGDGKLPAGRIKELFGVDFVGDPGANPGGLLSSRAFGDEPGQRGIAMEDMKPQQGETEAAFVARFTADDGMKGKYPDAAACKTAAQTAWVAAQPAPTPAPVAHSAAPNPNPGLSAEQAATEALAADRKRREGIMSLAAEKHMSKDWAQGLCDRGVSLAQAKELVILAEANQPMRIEVGEDRARIGLNQAVGDAIMLRAHRPVKEPHDRAKEFSGLSLIEIGRRWMQIQGMDTVGISRSEMATCLLNRFELHRRFGAIGLTLGTSDFPYILADVLNKTLRQAYELAPRLWRTYCRMATAPDYKTIKRVQLGGAPALASMAEGAEYTYGTMGESRETYVLGKYGKGLKLTREMLINDDLNAFDRIVPQMGMMAGYLEDDVAAAILTVNANMSDGLALFVGGHSNLGAGAISVANLGLARAALRKQTGIGGAILNIIGKVLLTPAALETTADQFVASVVDPSKSNATPNPFANRLTVGAEPRLDASSAAIWYLIGDPGVYDTIEVCFLEGEQAPVVEQEEDFDTDARKYKVRHTVGAKAIDWRAMYRSTGV